MFGFFKRRKKSAGSPATKPAAEVPPLAEQRLVDFVDVYGRSFQMPLERWRSEILRPSLDFKWDDPEALYPLIIAALGDHLAVDVDRASIRLMEIDPLVERAYVTRAIVQLQLDQPRAAGATLRQAIARVGESGILLTNQAKVFSAQGKHARAMATLDRALQLDPNQDNGLGWRVGELASASGNEAVQAYLRRLATHADSWRPQMLLGQYALEAGRREEGLAWFDLALERAPPGADVKWVVTGALGKRGLLNDLVQRVAPIYDQHLDDIRVGYNLLQAYVELGDANAGRALLEKLFALGRPPSRPHLLHYAKSFDEMAADTPKALDHVPEISFMQMELPPWLLGMQDMEWAAPPRGRDRPRIVLLPLAAPGDAGGNAVRSGREDQRGRLSRALPLFLLEQLVYCSDLAVAFNQPVADGHQLVLFGGALDDEQLEHLAPDFDWAVEGEVFNLEEGFSVVVRLRRLSDHSTRLRVERSFKEQDTGAALVVMTGELLAAIDSATSTTIEPRVPMYALPAAHINEYVSALAQSLALTLSSFANTRDSLFGERHIYGWLQRLAVSLAEHEPAQFMYFTALAKGRRMGSPIVDEFERPAAEHMQAQLRAGSYAARLLPLMVAVYPNNTDLGEALAAAKPFRDEAYSAWCGRLASAFPIVPTPPFKA